MSNGLQTTFEVLASTKNESAVAVLVPSLDSPHQQIQDETLRALLKRRCAVGLREVLQRLHLRAEQWRDILGEYSGRMSSVLRDAVMHTDTQMCVNACNAILWFAEYDLIPVLISAAEDPANPNADRAAVTLLELSELLYGELAAPRNYENRRDPQLVRRHVVKSLEYSLQRYSKHKRLELLEACLLLVSRDNATLKRILRDPHHPAFLTLIDTLTHSPRPGVMRLVLGFLDDPNAPSAALKVISHRNDEKFLGHLFRKVGYEPSAIAAKNLKKIKNIPWLTTDLSVLGNMNDSAQHGALQTVLASGMKRLDIFNLIEYLLRNGNIGGRRAATKALEEYKGKDANELVLLALEDEDPRVRALALGQLRQRNLPGAVTTLIESVDSPHEIIRDTVRDSLSEFSFERFLAGFELMENEQRVKTGLLVKKVDRTTAASLKSELTEKSRTRRLRAIEVAVVMQIVPEIQAAMIETLSDEDHMVRAQAALALQHCNTKEARDALGLALRDNSSAVQDAAQLSLQALASLAAEPA